MIKKNDRILLTITGMTEEGNGVGRYEGMAVFVPLSAVGDILNVHVTKVQKTYAYGIIDEILTPSPVRLSSDCAVFSKCGGCAFRHMTYEAEKDLKENFVKDAFLRIGKLEIPFQPILGCDEPDHYRNKAQYPVAEENGKAVCGFYSRRSHRVVPFTDCRLQPEVFRTIVDFILEYVNFMQIPAYSEQAGKGLLRHIYLRRGYHSGEIMVCFVTARTAKNEFMPLSKLLPEKFSDIKSVVLNVNPQNTNVILGRQTHTLWGTDTIRDTMCGNRIELSPQSFYQVNTHQAEKLYGLVAEYASLTGSESIMDLYCGAGTIGLSLAKRAKKVIGVEVVPQAIENAAGNARQNGITNMEFLCGDAAQVAVDLAAKGETPDIIIVDPPRKGCDRETLEAVLSMSPAKFIMVSCNPATAARDCAHMCENGYRMVEGRAVDLFPRTGHVETVVLMSRNI